MYILKKTQDFKITLKAARVNKNLTQKQVSKILKISKHTLLNWENGKIQPSYIAIIALGHLYDIDINNFKL